MVKLPEKITNTHGIHLPPRYSIRRVDAATAPWAKALIIHTFLLGPSIWSPLVPDPKVKSAWRAFEMMDGHYMHSLLSGHSYAVFDDEYEFSRDESRGDNGRLYWDELDPDAHGFEEHGRDLMERAMDFPLVCVGAAFDLFDKKPDEATASMRELIPLERFMAEYAAKMDPRGDRPEEWLPKKRGQAVARAGLVTRESYRGRGLMKALNHFMILEARASGFDAIMVGPNHPSVVKSWMNPPDGCKITVLAKTNVWEVSVEIEDGEVVTPYETSMVGRVGHMLWCEFV
jgi:hypothetical protein